MSITKQDEVTFGEIQKGSKFVLPDPLPPDCGKFMAYWVYEKALPTHAIIIGVKPNAPDQHSNALVNIASSNWILK